MPDVTNVAPEENVNTFQKASKTGVFFLLRAGIIFHELEKVLSGKSRFHRKIFLTRDIFLKNQVDEIRPLFEFFWVYDSAS